MFEGKTKAKLFADRIQPERVLKNEGERNSPEKTPGI